MKKQISDGFMERFAADFGEGIHFQPDMTVGELVAAWHEVRKIVAAFDHERVEAAAEVTV